MERFKTLLKLNIKRAYKSLFQLVFGAIALIFMVSAIAFCGNEYLYGGLNAAAEGTSFKLGVVMYDTSALAGTVTEGITGMKEISDTVEFVFTNEEDALSRLDTGEFIAVMIIPEDTANGIISGKNPPIQVVFPKNSGFEAVLIKEITDSAATILGSSQAGIYSIYDFYDDHGASSHKKDALNRMNLKYINMAATGMDMFDETEQTATGSIPLMTYYISGALVLFVMLMGINCYSFINRMSPNTSKRLIISGCSGVVQGLTQYISIAAVMLTTLCIVIIPAVFIMNIFHMELSATGIASLLLIIPIFVIVASAFVYFISQVTEHNMNRVMITFFASIAMCFISGCFIPSAMLPDAVQVVSYLLPSHYMMGMTANLLSSSFDGISIIMCLVYAVVLFFGGTLLSNLKLRKELR